MIARFFQRRILQWKNRSLERKQSSDRVASFPTEPWFFSWKTQHLLEKLYTFTGFITWQFLHLFLLGGANDWHNSPLWNVFWQFGSGALITIIHHRLTKSFEKTLSHKSMRLKCSQISIVSIKIICFHTSFKGPESSHLKKLNPSHHVDPLGLSKA